MVLTSNFLEAIGLTKLKFLMKRISLLLISSIFLSFVASPQARATEPALNFFDTVKFPEMLQNDVYKMKCTTTWDPSSKMTEIISRCSKKNLEVYAHGNATPITGDKSKYSAGPISYLSFTLKSSDLYSDFWSQAQMCAGAVHGSRDINLVTSTREWIVKNFNRLSTQKKITKSFAGHNVTLIAGAGATRTLTCGAKPSK